jgi:DMSO/TMAO reductase YedYZ molybdopterin-dependent catalytic subunit
LVSGKTLFVDELRGMRSTELVFGFECSGNRRPLQGLASSGRWTGVPLRTVLGQAGVKPEAREFVFFGADHGEEEVDFRGQKNKVDQQFGRSLSREKALSPEPLLAYAEWRTHSPPGVPASLCWFPDGTALPTSNGSPTSTFSRISFSETTRPAGTARCEARRSLAR